MYHVHTAIDWIGKLAAGDRDTWILTAIIVPFAILAGLAKRQKIKEQEARERATMPPDLHSDTVKRNPRA